MDEEVGRFAKFKKSFLYYLYLNLIGDTDGVYEYYRDFWPELFKLMPGRLKYFFLNFGLWLENDPVSPMQRMHLYTQEQAKIQDGDRILDIGSGYGGQNLLCCENYKPAEIIGVELNQYYVDHCNREVKDLSLDHIIRYVCADAINLPASIPENHFDKVMALHCLYHFSSRAQFFKAAYGRLKPGGRLITFDGYFKRLPQNKIERQIFRRKKYFGTRRQIALESQIIEDMKAAGFKSIEIDSQARNIYPPFYDFLCRNEKEIEAICKKYHYPKLMKNFCYEAARFMKIGVEAGLIEYAMIQAGKPG